MVEDGNIGGENYDKGEGEGASAGGGGGKGNGRLEEGGGDVD